MRKILAQGAADDLLRKLRNGEVRRKPFCVARFIERGKPVFVRCGSKAEFQSLQREYQDRCITVLWKRPNPVPVHGVPGDAHIY